MQYCFYTVQTAVSKTLLVRQKLNYLPIKCYRSRAAIEKPEQQFLLSDGFIIIRQPCCESPN